MLWNPSIKDSLPNGYYFGDENLSTYGRKAVLHREVVHYFPRQPTIRKDVSEKSLNLMQD